MSLKTKITGFIGIVIVIMGIFYFTFVSEGKHIEFEVKPGMNANQIVKRMKDKNIINYPNIFLGILKYFFDANKIQAGNYRVSLKSDYFSLAKKLTDGPNVFTQVSIPEGFTTEQIAVRLENREIIKSRKDFINLVEKKDLRGFLFPETYKFTKNTSKERIISAMVTQFNKNFKKAFSGKGDYEERLKKLGYTKKEIIILASLVEKEARVSRERPIISAIFHKRLKKNIYLESCASILFALGKHRRSLTYKDLEINSPYNTYKNPGLPPTPICNPGLDSIKAALYPADTEYLFFFTRGDGTHIFSETYEEHLEKQKKFNTIINKKKN
ncbi:MAG: endolytic transglycosylase MltG [Elusimicrobiota bacterium]